MKKLLALLLALAMVLCLFGCDSEEVDDTKILEDSPYNDATFYTSKYIYVDTQYDEYGDVSTIWFYIANFSSSAITYSRTYALEKYMSNDSWGTIPFAEEQSQTSALVVLSSDETVAFSFDLSDFDYTFTDGEYRIVMTLGDNLCYCEFSIGDYAISDENPYGYDDFDTLTYSFTVKDAIDTGATAITDGYNYNTDLIYDFVLYSTMGIPSMVRIIRFTEDTAISFTDIIYDGSTYTWKYDNTGDTSAEETGVYEETRGYLITDSSNVYLSDCSNWSLVTEENSGENILILEEDETTFSEYILDILIASTYITSDDESESEEEE